MSKSIKLTNDTYLDSTGIAHNQELLSNIINNKTIYDSGNNENGYYTRWNDGTMICRGIVQASANVGYADLTFPVPFVGDVNDITIVSNHKYTTGSGYGGSLQLRSITSPQVVDLTTGYIYSYYSDGTIATYPRNIQWIAISHWK